MKIKLVIIVSCLLILSFIPSFKNNFNSRKNKTSYKELANYFLNMMLKSLQELISYMIRFSQGLEHWL